MPSGVGARVRAARIVLGATLLAIGGLVVFTTPAHAQAAPPGGLSILKLANGGNTTASFEVSGPGIVGTTTLTANAVDGVPTLAGTPLTNLALGTYTITEVQPDQSSAFQFTQALCSNATSFTTRTIQVTLTIVNPVLTCTFVNTVTKATISGTKEAAGDTSAWTRPVLLHLSCPSLALEVDLGPVGPGGPGNYPIPFGFSVLQPSTCTLTETDTGGNSASVSMEVRNHGVVIATGTTSVTFSAGAGDDLVVHVRNVFANSSGGGTTPPASTPTTAATTTTASTATTASTTTAVVTTTASPGGGGATTTVAAASSTPSDLPTTGSPAGGLLVAALVAMLAGLALVARTRRFVE